ncbi:hypothetical protein [Nitrosococcus watsonii]|uniref:Uncharacterized protein n=1 Tax=Nitrosococcus watsoni (strain C-113) TaxID=105559 RepID=D8KBP6_NITWC|nr:hypothetical protein [Nitrosococcus watsonii]ADJ27657.1 conserved hypothetical protein [Nitrosococcus watsonii C-113]
MKKTLRYVWIFLPILAVGIVVASNQWLNSNEIILPNGEKVSPEELPTQAVLGIIAAQTNKSLPRKVDQNTELHNVEGREGELVYQYIKIHASSDQFDSQEFVEKMRQKALDLACNSPDLNIFLAHGVNARYSFRDKNHQPIGEVVVTPDQCGY